MTRIKNDVKSEDIVEYHFHFSLESRKKYHLDGSFFSTLGNIIVTNFAQARILAEKINTVRKSDNKILITPGLVNALALYHEVYHVIIREYENSRNPGVLNRALTHLSGTLGADDIQKLLLKFVQKFPPLSVYREEETPEQYLNRSTGITPNREIILEELIILHLENFNPAFNLLQELFDDAPLKETKVYEKFLTEAENYFEKESPVFEGSLRLMKFLKQPILEHPDNVDLQLKFILANWKIALPESFLLKILGGTDLIYEDSKLFTQHGGKGGTPGVQIYKTLSADELRELRERMAALGKNANPDTVPNYYYAETVQFTQDTEWMPKVVMIAKNSFVWLDQLSKKYGRNIKTLDAIPDEELDTFQLWNLTALWLIGVWERSTASQKVKQFCGNHDAVSSAYSLYDYEIASALGGFSAYENLKHRCWQRGIRLASDMVPNHTGIFSKWVLEHPDYFIQAETPPFPGYSFTGPDLSDDGRFEIRIEDKYYTRQDAAVVFQLLEKSNGRVRYLYHGNDGTNMPWNDTAQLNLLKEEVREALIQQIKHVASMFPIIRFDAAMTLTKKHFQRLWFPQPGTAGAIASRADYALTREDFDKVIPNEFWREVVDRLNREMPDTLLLAEAFWLMEGYFVRTLGMHRVYNSAFMHMFMKEENSKYKELIQSTLEFNPEILKRYVNFMSNPDEETAINQFGKGDKYFGVCLMLVTLPGLPMLAHGQVEGFTEKYGMEYQRAYYNEIPDQWLVDRHKNEIFPIIGKRYLFSSTDNFWFFDFVVNGNSVNQNVFAFTNGTDNEKALVLFNNSYEQTTGKVHFTTGKRYGDAQNEDNTHLSFSNLGASLGLRNEDNLFYICQDSRTKLEFLLRATDIYAYGFSTYLSGYEYKVLWQFRDIKDDSGYYSKLYDILDGKGVPSVENAVVELKTGPLHIAIEEVFNINNMEELCVASGFNGERAVKIPVLSQFIVGKILTVINELRELGYQAEDPGSIVSGIRKDIYVLNNIYNHVEVLCEKGVTKDRKKVKLDISLFSDVNKAQAYKNLILIFLFIRRILVSVKPKNREVDLLSLYNELQLSRAMWQSLIRLGDNYDIIKQEFDLLGILLSDSYQFEMGTVKDIKESHVRERITALIANEWIRQFIGYNVYQNIVYYNKEKFESLLKWIFLIKQFERAWKSLHGISIITEKDKILKYFSLRSTSESIKNSAFELVSLVQLANTSEYKLKIFLDAMNTKTEIAQPKKKPVAKKEVVLKKKAVSAKKTVKKSSKKNNK
jgi:glycosidase